ncbi:hypothetical protein GUITHDRAFT_142781 [Guillardia theta CCMP2712]|uniref:Uncharacterized protein n=1 Tax=Guillardia theta (strain CCMP2712) TaxID=905079 RepID=L1IX94_GUITC|nr:hypothetical protein GUITHDRAFT_142781 [Guillardia theta CCMP2712]EKX40475.1 hypothetical protein GUITHDRAFT_142781 [Guillardia theta CCMP2712]|eukprot:XP_005827455.1 hypothetical protein GUITHDRAFT_142781 [Guillardia theta CCMP2712]
MARREYGTKQRSSSLHSSRVLYIAEEIGIVQMKRSLNTALPMGEDEKKDDKGNYQDQYKDGSFRWRIVPNKLRKEEEGEQNDNTGINLEETNDQEDQEKDYIPKFTPKTDNDSKLLKYEIDILTGNLARKNVYIYEYAQPNFNVASSSIFYYMVSSPLCGILQDYKNLTEAKARSAYADQWNLQGSPSFHHKFLLKNYLASIIYAS